jgi:hypothetical protein
LFERTAQAEVAEAENKVLKDTVNSLRTHNVELEVATAFLCATPYCLLACLYTYHYYYVQALVSKYMDDIRSAQDELQLTKEQFESEINIRSKLVQLHEDKAAEASAKAQEFECTRSSAHLVALGGHRLSHHSPMCTVVVEQAKASISSIKQQYEEQLSRVQEEKHRIADKYAKSVEEVLTRPHNSRPTG